MKSKNIPIPIFITIIFSVAILTLLSATLLWGLFFEIIEFKENIPRLINSPTEKIAAVVTAALTTTGGLGAIGIMALNYRKQELEERLEISKSQEQFDSNFTRYVEMISKNDVTSITGGLWGLSALADQYAAFINSLPSHQLANNDKSGKDKKSKIKHSKSSQDDVKYFTLNLLSSHEEKQTNKLIEKGPRSLKSLIETYSNYISNKKQIQIFNQRCVNVICSLIRTTGAQLENGRACRKDVEAIQFTAMSVLINHIKLNSLCSSTAECDTSYPFQSGNPWSKCKFDFHETTFWCPLRIEQSLFLNKVDFWGCEFKRAIYGTGSIFSNVNFNATKFEGPRTIFNRSTFQNISVQGDCKFRNEFNLEDASLLTPPKLYNSDKNGSVNSTNGNTEVYFEGKIDADVKLRYDNLSVSFVNVEDSSPVGAFIENLSLISDSKHTISKADTPGTVYFKTQTKSLFTFLTFKK